MPKYEVVTGSLKFEDGDFQKGDTFEVSAERAAMFDPKDIKLIEEPAAPVLEVANVEVKPLPKTTKKAKVAETSV